MTDQTEFEAMLRRYLAKIAARYAPVIAGVVVLLLIIILVPTTQPTSTLGTGTFGSPSPGQASATPPSGPSPGGTAPANPSQPQTTNPVTGAPTATAPAPGPTTAFAVGSTSGMAKTGVQCAAGVRQFTWSGHSPNCVAAYTGGNGGATAHGVTASTITLTFRIPNSAEDQTIAALAGSANVNYPAMIADMQTYIRYFNSQFELYGRHVVLKAYNGQGDYISEDQGQNLAGAQADAVTAHDMGAFGDVTFSLGASEAYEQDLAAEHVISFSSVAEPQSWYQTHAPYEFSVQGPSGTNGIAAAAAVVCRRLAGMPAIFAGDATIQARQRVFGIIYPENPNYSQEEKQYEQTIGAQCGAHPAAVVAYPINVSQYTQEALSTMALMNSKHVTTVLCACDPIFPILLSRAADSQGYHPEWFTADFGDPVTQDYTADQWSHSFAGGTQIPPASQTEGYKVYQLASPGHQPAEEPPTSPPYFYVPYYTVLHVFDALQAAGPDLNPVTFAQGMFSLPPSAPDAVGGQWVFGTNVYDPVASFGLVWWNATATSTFDGKAGTYLACNQGHIYTMDNLAALGGPHVQLSCFGRAGP